MHRTEQPRFQPPPDLDVFYFGSGGRSLYGCCHQPPAERRRGLGVVICYPSGHEYIQAHRVIRTLASLLGQAGCTVLRFDLTGCGDSAGDERDWSWDRWREDVSAAVGRVRQLAGAGRLCLIGLRLGASLAMVTASEAIGCDRLVLWDPIVNGEMYVQEQHRLHARMLESAHVIPRPETAGIGGTELLGFRFPDSLLADIRKMDLLAERARPADDVLIMETKTDAALGALSAHLTELGSRVDYRTESSPEFWRWAEDYGKIFVPRGVVQAIADWISRDGG